MGIDPSPKSKTHQTAFRVGSGTQKLAQKLGRDSLKNSTGIENSQDTQNSQGTKNNNGEQNSNGDVAKAERENAQTFAQTRPGGTAKAAQKAVARTQGRDILNRFTGGSASPPGSAYNKINNARNNANDMASWQAMLKGSQETAKAIADGIGKAFASLGQVGATFAKMAEKKAGGEASAGGGGQQAAGGGGKQAAQDQGAFAQNDAQQGQNGAQNS